MTMRIVRLILTALIVLALFIPSYIAIANYSILGSWQNTLTEESSVLTVSDKDGVTVFRGVAGEPNNKALAQALASLLENGKALRGAPDLADTELYTVTAQLTKKSQDYQ